MKIKKWCKIGGGIVLLFLFVKLIGYIISPGSNSRAEYYKMSIPNNQIINKVSEFKEHYPNYKYTRLDRDGNPFIYMEDGPNGFYLTLPSLNVSVTCIIEYINGESAIGLLSAEGKPIPKGSGNLNNGDIPRKLNQEIKKEFEEKFLNRIGTWERIDTGNSFFGLYF